MKKKLLSAETPFYKMGVYEGIAQPKLVSEAMMDKKGRT